MGSSTIVQSLPAPPAGRTGWPWTESCVLPRDIPAVERLPRISIVTPSYQQGVFLEETIRSILLQGYPNLEYLIMDGGSRDSSLEIISKYEKHLAGWVSERDRGQSHAINKGLSLCTGDIFNWINSDDLLLPGALWAVAQAWLENPGRIVAGGTEFFNDSGIVQRVKAGGQTLRNFVRFWEAEEFGWAQPSTFIPMTGMRGLEGIREDLTYCMDYHMMVRLLLKGATVAYVDEPLARFRVHADSKTTGRTREHRLERIEVLRNMDDLPIRVRPGEWDRQQAIRLVDIARHAFGQGCPAHGARLTARAFVSSPLGATHEICRRALGKLRRPSKAEQTR